MTVTFRKEFLDFLELLNLLVSLQNHWERRQFTKLLVILQSHWVSKLTVTYTLYYCGGKALDKDYSEIIDNFVTSFGIVHEKFGTTYTNKIHIIQDHLKYYLKKTNQGLGYHTDQLVESMHQHTNKKFQNQITMYLKRPIFWHTWRKT